MCLRTTAIIIVRNDERFLADALQSIVQQTRRPDEVPFDPAFALAFEIDWFARAQDAGEQSAVIERVLLHKRIHAQNNSIQQERFRSEGFVVLRRTLARKRMAQLAATEPNASHSATIRLQADT